MLASLHAYDSHDRLVGHVTLPTVGVSDFQQLTGCLTTGPQRLNASQRQRLLERFACVRHLAHPSWQLELALGPSDRAEERLFSEAAIEVFDRDTDELRERYVLSWEQVDELRERTGLPEDFLAGGELEFDELMAEVLQPFVGHIIDLDEHCYVIGLSVSFDKLIAHLAAQAQQR